MSRLALFAALLAAESSASPPEMQKEVWAGHEVLEGKRRIPVYGEKETHTENFVIAQVERTRTRIEIRQKLCRVEIRPVKGVYPIMKPETVARLLKARIVFEVKPDGTLKANPWDARWGSEDLDGDGFPGATVQISGTRCSGDLHISNQSTSTMTYGRLTPDGAAGFMSVRVKQEVLSAKGLCLKVFAGDSDETQAGRFAYRRVEAGTTCESLAGKPWPVKAQAGR